jgi:thermostable 8-oxoguanine DNA glycosylase
MKRRFNPGRTSAGIVVAFPIGYTGQDTLSGQRLGEFLEQRRRCIDELTSVSSFSPGNRAYEKVIETLAANVGRIDDVNALLVVASFGNGESAGIAVTKLDANLNALNRLAGIACHLEEETHPGRSMALRKLESRVNWVMSIESLCIVATRAGGETAETAARRIRELAQAMNDTEFATEILKYEHRFQALYPDILETALEKVGCNTELLKGMVDGRRDLKRRAIEAFSSMVDRIGDDEILLQVAVYSDDPAARIRAVERISDDPVLARVAGSHLPEAVEQQLRTTAQSSGVEYHDTGHRAIELLAARLEELTDDRALCAVARYCPEHSARAIERMSIDTLSELFVCEHANDAAMQRALDNIESIGDGFCFNNEFIVMAGERIESNENEYVICAIANIHPNMGTRAVAVAMLEEMIESIENPVALATLLMRTEKNDVRIAAIGKSGNAMNLALEFSRTEDDDVRQAIGTRIAELVEQGECVNDVHALSVVMASSRTHGELAGVLATFADIISGETENIRIPINGGVYDRQYCCAEEALILVGNESEAIIRALEMLKGYEPERAVLIDSLDRIIQANRREWPSWVLLPDGVERVAEYLRENKPQVLS